MEGYVNMAHQVGGHATSKTSLKCHNGFILKPYQDQNRGARENEFYKRVYAAKDDIVLSKLRELIPEYHGSVEVQDRDERPGASLHVGQYLKLGDLTWKLHFPCIVDVKVGTRSYEDGASPEKIAYERSKFPLQEQVGFRIQGIKVYDPAAAQYMEYDKHFGRGMKDLGAIEAAFACYFAPLPSHHKWALLEQFIRRLERLEHWFRTQTQFEFIASSLLFIYDGGADVAAISSGSSTPLCDVRLIDFAHVQYPTTAKVDEGVLLGIRTILACFRTLLSAATKSQLE